MRSTAQWLGLADSKQLSDFQKFKGFYELSKVGREKI